MLQSLHRHVHNAIAVFGIKAKHTHAIMSRISNNAIAVFGIKAKPNSPAGAGTAYNAIAVFGIKAKLNMDFIGVFVIMPLPFLESRQSTILIKAKNEA